MSLVQVIAGTAYYSARPDIRKKVTRACLPVKSFFILNRQAKNRVPLVSGRPLPIARMLGIYFPVYDLRCPGKRGFICGCGQRIGQAVVDPVDNPESVTLGI